VPGCKCAQRNGKTHSKRAAARVDAARWPAAAIDVPVGSVRAFDFQADDAGDRALHCHKSHHTRNAMGHDLNTYFGVDLGEARRKIARVVGGNDHPKGSRGMAEMVAMEMPGAG
jgi:manganese oxidase